VDGVWLQTERERGRNELARIATQRRVLQTDAHGLGRFAQRMAFVDVTGSVAAWATALQDALAEAGDAEGAATLASSPPFAAGQPTAGDCDRLAAYVEARLALIEDLLGRAGG
jgi:hypothetical protein